MNKAEWKKSYAVYRSLRNAAFANKIDEHAREIMIDGYLAYEKKNLPGLWAAQFRLDYFATFKARVGYRRMIYTTPKLP